MDKTYKNIWILFLSVLVVIFLGFYKTYFGILDSFEEISTALHLHTLLFLFWFAMLFIQPYLIRKKKFRLHRIIGKSSYILVPLLVISVFFVAKQQYIRDIGLMSRDQCIANLIVPLPQIALFVGFYIMSIVHRKNVGFHVRYIVSATLVLIGPGIGRFFILGLGLTFQEAVMASFLVTELVALGLILYDRKNGNNPKPYVILLGLFIFTHIAWFFLPQSVLWQTLCGNFVDLVF